MCFSARNTKIILYTPKAILAASQSVFCFVCKMLETKSLLIAAEEGVTRNKVKANGKTWNKFSINCDSEFS